MRSILRKAFFLFSILAILVTGCSTTGPISPSSATPEILPTATSPATAILTAAPLPTALSTVFPTLTQTPLPTATLTLTPTLPPAEAITRGPYLQNVERGSIWVVWDTAQSSTGWVAYGPTAALGQVAVESQAALHHQVQLSGLADYTEYYYRAAGDSATYSFRSAPAPGQQQFTFAVLGDTRANPEVHSAIIAGIAAARPDFVLHTGDLVDDGNDSGLWDAFLKIEAPVMRIAPLYPTLGNHENDSSQYFDIFHLPGNGSWYAFDYGNARIIVLKADTYDASPFAPGGQQRTWLEQQLASAGGRWIFVSFHVAVHTSFAEDPSEVNLRNALAPLFEQYKVTAVFNGHIHSYERVLAGGVTYVVIAGGGAPLYSLNVKEAGQQAAALVYNYTLFEVSGDTVSGRAISVDGKVIDSFEIKATRP